jgi:hypothetical protein
MFFPPAKFPPKDFGIEGTPDICAGIGVTRMIVETSDLADVSLLHEGADFYIQYVGDAIETSFKKVEFRSIASESPCVALPFRMLQLVSREPGDELHENRIGALQKHCGPRLFRYPRRAMVESNDGLPKFVPVVRSFT